MRNTTATFGAWPKSMHADGGSGNCVEVAGGNQVNGVRDGGTLLSQPANWAGFVATL